MTNEQMPIDEQLQEIFDSCSDDVPDMHFIYGRAVWQAATIKERERCALVCEQQVQMYDDALNASKDGTTATIVTAAMKLTARGCAAAIRMPPTGTGGNK